LYIDEVQDQKRKQMFRMILKHKYTMAPTASERENWFNDRGL
jgi:hypothetical protein